MTTMAGHPHTSRMDLAVLSCVCTIARRVLVVVLERLEWDPYATTALQVTTMQEFRDLFAAEVLARGQEIGVQSLAILFSDLKDSTASMSASATPGPTAGCSDILLFN